EHGRAQGPPDAAHPVDEERQWGSCTRRGVGREGLGHVQADAVGGDVTVPPGPVDPDYRRVRRPVGRRPQLVADRCGVTVVRAVPALRSSPEGMASLRSFTESMVRWGLRIFLILR